MKHTCQTCYAAPALKLASTPALQICGRCLAHDLLMSRTNSVEALRTKLYSRQ